MNLLTKPQARTFYDRFGRKQDSQAFYEDAAINDLIAHGAFEQANSVFEIGCGTGRLAVRLLAEHLPSSARYLGVDISSTMADISQQRISAYAERAKIIQSDGSMRFPVPDKSTDRVLSTYMFDLLPEFDIREAINETRRILTPKGKFCLVSLTDGVNFTSRLVSKLWKAVFQLHAPLVGGCRPLQLSQFFGRDSWSIEYRNVVTAFGVPSEIFIASPKDDA